MTDRFEVIDVLDNGLGQKKTADEVEIIGRRRPVSLRQRRSVANSHESRGALRRLKVLLVSCFLSQLDARQARVIILHTFVFTLFSSILLIRLLAHLADGPSWRANKSTRRADS